jgi:hypothetical protein
MAPEPVTILLLVARTLESLGIPYCVGGSFASSFYGVPRSTNDVDVVVALRREHITPLVVALEDEFMIDAQAMEAAIASGCSFNIINYDTLDKIDVFVVADQPWSREQIHRRRLSTLPDHPDAPALYLASPEDVILIKLAWYRSGGEISDRQWLDILNVLALQADNLDWAYLRQWASELGVSDLLSRASAQSESDSTTA